MASLTIVDDLHSFLGTLFASQRPSHCDPALMIIMFYSSALIAVTLRGV